jgi:hypothetical protein
MGATVTKRTPVQQAPEYMPDGRDSDEENASSTGAGVHGRSQMTAASRLL